MISPLLWTQTVSAQLKPDLAACSHTLLWCYHSSKMCSHTLEWCYSVALTHWSRYHSSKMCYSKALTMTKLVHVRHFVYFKFWLFWTPSPQIVSTIRVLLMSGRTIEIVSMHLKTAIQKTNHMVWPHSIKSHKLPLVFLSPFGCEFGVACSNIALSHKIYLVWLARLCIVVRLFSSWSHVGWFCNIWGDFGE